MATETIEFEVASRERVGKGAARQVRREGRVPAVIYGDKKEPQAISLDYKEVWKMYLKGQFTAKVFKLKLDGQEHLVVSRDVQLDPVKDTVVHVDFLRIGGDGLIRVAIPVKFLNEHICPGMKRGGVLNVVRHDIEVWCPYDKIPDAFEIDLAEAQIGQSIHVSAVTMPEGAKPTIQDRDFTIATIAGRGPAGGAEDEDEAATDEAAAEGEGEEKQE
ncbi:MAG: 50S ribosomal protein L25/general stress protein Ctc [Alphaproteobacteria bacterium]|nr:50S ribosomal protein L25/general stress protein Ctc [Alphaproteobacteria bacterium]